MPYLDERTIESLRMENGKLQSFAWPGGYPIYFWTADMGVLCPNCANRENGSIAYIGKNPETWDDGTECPNDKQWKLIAFDIHYEGDPLQCDHCNKEIESAYGPLDEENDNESKSLPKCPGPEANQERRRTD